MASLASSAAGTLSHEHFDVSILPIIVGATRGKTADEFRRISRSADLSAYRI